MSRRKSRTLCCPVCALPLANLDGAAAGIGGIPVTIGAPAPTRTRRNSFFEATFFCVECDGVRTLAFDQRNAAVAMSWRDEDGKRLHLPE